MGLVILGSAEASLVATGFMIEVFHLSPGRSIRVLWLLEEIGAPYRIEGLAMPIRERSPEYLALNPAGLFPTVVDNGEVLLESLSICDHIARHHGGTALVRNPEDPDYRAYFQWMLFGEATLGTPLANIMRYGPRQPQERQIPQVMEDARVAFTHRLTALETRLEQSHFMASDQFTLADISVGYTIWLSASFFSLEADFGPRTSAYLDRLLSRKPLQRALAKG